MASGFSRTPLLLKGALIEFSERFIGPVPNVIIFQYNPETITRTLEVWDPDAKGAAPAAGQTETTATVQPADPKETFNLTLQFDASDALEMGHPVAVISGVADRIAAMEMLLYPQTGTLAGQLLSSAGSALGGAAGSALGSLAGKVGAIPRNTVPIVLFSWGPGRIVPVRLKSFSVVEESYSPLLYPLRAKVTVGLQVLTDNDLKEEGFSRDIAVQAFRFTKKQKQILAAANIANTIESILPF